MKRLSTGASFSAASGLSATTSSVGITSKRIGYNRRIWASLAKVAASWPTSEDIRRCRVSIDGHVQEPFSFLLGQHRRALAFKFLDQVGTGTGLDDEVIFGPAD